MAWWVRKGLWMWSVWTLGEPGTLSHSIPLGKLGARGLTGALFAGYEAGQSQSGGEGS